jgi:hypothetical protein
VNGLTQRFKRLVRRLLPALFIRRIVTMRDRVRLSRDLPGRLADLEARVLRAQYPALAAPGADEFGQADQRVFSQNGEDGRIAWLLSKVGAVSRTFCEIGIEDGTECNCANLAINLGWKGLMVEGNPGMAKSAQRHFDRRAPGRVTVHHQFVTRENINDIFRKNGLAGEIDLLSIDVDGIDYWLWQAVEAVNPRVVVIEYNSLLGPSEALTVPYEDSFSRFEKDPSGYYHGASVKALEKLGISKGYSLIGCDSLGINAFFVRSDLLRSSMLVARAAESAFQPFTALVEAGTVQDAIDIVRRLPLQQV